MNAVPPTLVTPRLVLAPAEAQDFGPSAALWADPEVLRFIGGAARTPQEVWSAMLRNRGMWDVVGFGYWTVRWRDGGAFAGEVGFADFRRGLTPDISGLPEAGWVIAPNAWGKGVASEAVAAAHEWLDRERPGPSACIIEPGNLASIRIARKLGYAEDCRTTHRGATVGLFRRPGPAAR